MKIDKILDFSKKVGNLKKLNRSGWVRHNVSNPESVAAHSFRSALLALVLSKEKKVKRDRVVFLVLVHDLAESIVGDITPFEGISKEEKHNKEHKAMKSISGEIESPEILNLFEEYLDGTTPESLIAKEIDNFELMLQAYEYELEQKINLEEFWDYSKNYNFDFFKEEFEDLLKKRKSR